MKAILLFMLSIGSSAVIVHMFDITGPLTVVVYFLVAAFSYLFSDVNDIKLNSF